MRGVRLRVSRGEVLLCFLSPEEFLRMHDLPEDWDWRGAMAPEPWQEGVWAPMRTFACVAKVSHKLEVERSETIAGQLYEAFREVALRGRNPAVWVQLKPPLGGFYLFANCPFDGWEPS